MDPNNGKQHVGYEQINSQLDHTPHSVDQNNHGCPSQVAHSYSIGPVHHVDKSYMGQEITYSPSVTQRIQPRDTANHGVINIRSAPKGFASDTFSGNININTSPSRGRSGSQIHYTSIRDDSACVGNMGTKSAPIALTVSHHQQTRDDNSLENGIYIGTPGVSKSLQRDDNSGCITTPASIGHTQRNAGNLQMLIAKDPTGYRPPQNVSDKSSMLSEQSDDGNYKLGTKDYTERNLPQELMSKMFGLLKEGMFCDAVVLAGDKEIRVHKMVLIAASPFLLSKMSKTTPSTSLRVELPSGIPLQVASQLVHYLYDGKVTLTTDNVSQFARVANIFKLEHLINICEDFVDCFNLDQSLLAVLEEDIRVSATVPEDQPKVFPIMPTLSSPTKQPQDTQREETGPNMHVSLQEDPIEDLEYAPEDVKRKKGKRKSAAKCAGVRETIENECPPKPIENIVTFKPEITDTHQAPLTEEKDPKVTHKISHFYGTRAASAASKQKKENDDISPSPKKSLSAEDAILVQSTSPIKPRKGVKKGKKVKKEINKALMVKKGKMIHVVHGKNVLEKMEADQETGLDDEDLENVTIDEPEEMDGDGDDDWEMVMNIEAFPGCVTNIADPRKTGRQKKFLTVTPPKMEMPLRPPPKKRAREFTKTEEENSAEISSIIEITPDIPAHQLPENTAARKVVQKNKKRRKKGWGKTQMTISKSCLSNLVTDLENNAESIPEQDRQFKCNLCGNEFVFAKRSITHVLKTHDISANEVLNFITIRKFEKTPKVCDICGYETKDPNFYYVHYHKYFRHGVPLPKGWKPFTCDICGKECFTKFQLKDHKLIHVEETPFICEICGQGFKSRTCLNSHVFHKHSTERKHECKECDKTFKTRTQLVVHSRIHTGEKPFHCPDCSYKSTTRGNMRLHLTNKHKFDYETIKCMMYQIKTLAKSYELPSDIIDVEPSINESGVVNIATDKKIERNTFKHNTQHTQAPQEESDQNNFANNANIKFSNLLVTQDANQTGANVSYQSAEGQEQHLLLQNYHPQVVTTENLQQGQTTTMEIPVSNSHATTTQVLMPIEHLQQSHYIVQTHQADENTGILTPVGNQSIVHDPRVLGQETHILVPENHTLVSNEQIILSEQDQITLNSATRGQGHHVLYTERDIADQAHMLIAERSSTTPLQEVINIQTSEKISELQNVPPQVFIEANHPNVIHIQTVQLETDEHGQIITHRERKGQNYALAETHSNHPATVTLVHEESGSEKVDAGSSSLEANLHKQVQQHIGQISMSNDIIPENYHQTSYSASSTSHTTYVVNSQNSISTTIDSVGQVGGPTPSPSQSHTPQSNNSQTPPPSQSPAGLSAHGYTDAQLYQFYQQPYQNY